MGKYTLIFLFTFIISIHCQQIADAQNYIAHSDLPDLSQVRSDLLSNSHESNGLENEVLDILFFIPLNERQSICGCDGNPSADCYALNSSHNPTHCDSCCRYFCGADDTGCINRCRSNQCGSTIQ